MSQPALSPRRQLIASLVAQGWSNTRIARHLGLSLTCVKDARRLPAVRAEIAAEAARLQETMRFELAKAMAEEERVTFERWKALRDQDDNLPVALGAVRAHLDRVVPKAAVVKEQQPLTVLITLEERRYIERVCREVGVALPGSEDDAG